MRPDHGALHRVYALATSMGFRSPVLSASIGAVVRRVLGEAFHARVAVALGPFLVLLTPGPQSRTNIPISLINHDRGSVLLGQVRGRKLFKLIAPAHPGSLVALGPGARRQRELDLQEFRLPR
jgi:hypothetical protein